MKKFLACIAVACMPAALAAPSVNDATVSGSARMIVGNDVATSDEDYASGSDWLALACESGGCRLLPAALRVSAGEDGLQRLHFSTPENPTAPVQAWLHRDAAQPWLREGPVLTYASSETKNDSPVGSLSVAVPGPAHPAALVGLFDQARNDVLLQLREPSLRQTLGELGLCASPEDTSWFRWAGDLDADGKPDYLIVYPRKADGVHAVLYLSSAAAAGQLVGEVAVFDSAVAFSRCARDAWQTPE